MEPFNIKVGFGVKEVTLTILPSEEGYYKVIYYGGILGAVRLEKDTNGWEIVPDGEYDAGDLPFYKPNLNADQLDFILDTRAVDEIGEEIESKHHDLNENF
jgi:hypothetical protein